MKRCSVFLRRVFASPARVYAAALVLAAGLHLAAALLQGCGYLAGFWRAADLTLADFTAQGTEWVDAWTLISTDGDPQLVYDAPGHSRIHTLEVQLTHSQHPGEVVLFYSLRDTGGFTPERMVYGVRAGDDTWRFAIPLGARRIRLDPCAVPSVTCRFTAIRTDPVTLAGLTGFAPAGLFWLLVLPGIGYGLFGTEKKSKNRL